MDNKIKTIQFISTHGYSFDLIHPEIETNLWEKIKRKIFNKRPKEIIKDHSGNPRVCGHEIKPYHIDKIKKYAISQKWSFLEIENTLEVYCPSGALNTWFNASGCWFEDPNRIDEIWLEFSYKKFIREI